MWPYSRARENEIHQFGSDEQNDQDTEVKKESEILREKFDRIVTSIELEDFRLKPGTKEHEQMLIRDKYLPIEDRAVIRQGLEKLSEELGKKSNEELPNMVIFPDTAARPLFYVVKPLFDQLYRERGIPTPTYRFLVAWRQDSEEADEAREKFNETVEQDDEEADEDQEGFYKLNEKEIPKQLEDPVKERIDEMLNELKDGRKNILVVDDYLSRGSTLEQIDRLFYENTAHKTGNKPSADFFTFYGSSNLGRKSEVDSSESNYPKFFNKVFSGTTNNHVFGFFGFDYRTRSDSFFPSEDEVKYFLRQKRMKLGVKKLPGKKYVSLDELRDMAMVRNLRQALSQEALNSIKWIKQEQKRKKED